MAYLTDAHWSILINVQVKNIVVHKYHNRQYFCFLEEGKLYFITKKSVILYSGGLAIFILAYIVASGFHKDVKKEHMFWCSK